MVNLVKTALKDLGLELKEYKELDKGFCEVILLVSVDMSLKDLNDLLCFDLANWYNDRKTDDRYLECKWARGKNSPEFKVLGFSGEGCSSSKCPEKFEVSVKITLG